MLTINVGETKHWIMTLTEKTTIQGANYLFEAFNKETNNYTYMILPADLSQYSDRYNKYEITETSTPTLPGQITLPKGDYVYRVYEQVSDTNIDPTGLNCVEENALASKSSIINTEYEAQTTNTVYES